MITKSKECCVLPGQDDETKRRVRGSQTAVWEDLLHPFTHKQAVAQQTILWFDSFNIKHIFVARIHTEGRLFEQVCKKMFIYNRKKWYSHLCIRIVPILLIHYIFK